MPDDENLEINANNEEEEEDEVSAVVIDDSVITGMVIEETVGAKVERKKLITVVEWDNTSNGGTASDREVIGARVEDSSIEWNPDIETTTDILGVTYNDVNKTEPQQDVDMPILAGGLLSAYLTKAMFSNNISAYNGKFTVYLITAFISPASSTYYAVKHTGCSIIPSNIGGSTNVVSSVQVKLSNNLTEGTVPYTTGGKIVKNFTFSAASGN